MSKKRNPKRRKKRKKSLVRKFLGIVTSIVFVYILGILCFFVYALFSENQDISDTPNIIEKVVQKVKVPDRTTVLVACVDEGSYRTDGIMLVNYNSVNHDVSIVSIPRDTKVIDIPDYMWDVMVENYPEIKGDNRKQKKINAISSYGKEQGMAFLKQYIEEWLDIDIDYTVSFDFEGFRYIIDSIGGIEFDVPIRMKYSDPTQDLYIDLEPGMQVLDGDKSEQLLRFRKDNYGGGYSRADLDRIDVQQAFLKVFFEKVSNLDTILSNPKEYLTTLNKYVNTTFTVSDAIKYIGELPNISIDDIKTYVIPFTEVNSKFVLTDEQQVRDFAYEIFKAPVPNPEKTKFENSYDKSIQILNGSLKKGMANKAKELLESKGYSIKSIGDWNFEKYPETKIFVSSVEEGQDLLKFFNNAKIVVYPEKCLELGYAINIVIGKDDTLVENEVLTDIEETFNDN